MPPKRSRSSIKEDIKEEFKEDPVTPPVVATRSRRTTSTTLTGKLSQHFVEEPCCVDNEKCMQNMKSEFPFVNERGHPAHLRCNTCRVVSHSASSQNYYSHLTQAHKCAEIQSHYHFAHRIVPQLVAQSSMTHEQAIAFTTQYEALRPPNYKPSGLFFRSGSEEGDSE
eukprot:PhM_4_TR13210/c0_g1_i1/m.2408